VPLHDGTLFRAVDAVAGSTAAVRARTAADAPSRRCMSRTSTLG
jgi:hypothetical protein